MSAEEHEAARQKKLAETAARVEEERQQTLRDTSLLAKRQHRPQSAPSSKGGGVTLTTLHATADTDEKDRRARKATTAQRLEKERQEALQKTSVIAQRRVKREARQREAATQRKAQRRIEAAVIVIQAAYVLCLTSLVVDLILMSLVLSKWMWFPITAFPGKLSHDTRTHI